ncbi:unnamed protein product [Paramecium sonneborni]|uniref:Uncharacterized protein n=1 Tax=Paramecium sonneborni TaxID=65129 RepID=A0A8S1KF29_9CILI|nr:unnamed protein product [Paramecium sonneborni]
MMKIIANINIRIFIKEINQEIEVERLKQRVLLYMKDKRMAKKGNGLKKKMILLEDYYKQCNGYRDKISEQMKGRTLAQCKQYWLRKKKCMIKKNMVFLKGLNYQRQYQLK